MSHTNPLPELPKPEGVFWTDHGYGREPIPRTTFQYLADQMHAYGRKCYDLGARSTAAQPLTLTDAEIDRVFDAHEEAPQLAYRYLVAHALLAAAQPAGWKLVPIEPTADMRNAFHAVTDDDVTMKGAAGSRWAAMLAAAPPAASGDSTPPSVSSVPYRAISQVLASEMKRAVTNGANSVSMPDELVEIAAWLDSVQGDPSGALRPEPEAVGQDRALLKVLRSVRGDISIARATLMDSVETHGTHGGWLHEEARRLERAQDECDAAIDASGSRGD